MFDVLQAHLTFVIIGSERKRTRTRHFMCTALELRQSAMGHDSKRSPLGSVSGVNHYIWPSRQDLKPLRQAALPFRCRHGLTWTLHHCQSPNSWRQ